MCGKVLCKKMCVCVDVSLSHLILNKENILNLIKTSVLCRVTELVDEHKLCCNIYVST